VNAPAVPPKRFWLLGAGFTIWCSALVIMYALHAVGCAFGWSITALRTSLVLTLLLHLGAIGWLWLRFARSRPAPAQGETGAFMHWTVVWALATAFVAAVLTLAPALLLSTCV
jgi:hypothetical protein